MEPETLWSRDPMEREVEPGVRVSANGTFHFSPRGECSLSRASADVVNGFVRATRELTPRITV